MPLISSSTIIRTLSILHLTTAYYLLTAPALLPTQNLVLVLGASMKLPITTSALSVPSTATALGALVLAALATSDLLAAALSQHAFDEYWSVQAPVRCTLWGILTVWIYVTGRDVGGGLGGVGVEGLMGQKGGLATELRNGFVFSVGFVETSVLFWLFLTLRDERVQAARELAEKQKREEDRL